MIENKGASSLRADRATAASQSNPQAVSSIAGIPSAEELRWASCRDPLSRHGLMRSIISALAENPKRAQLVVQMPERQAAQPREVWIEDLSAWVRLDGNWVSLDSARGAFKPDINEAICIRMAAEHWERAQ